ncbi:hypothetical protein [Streptomyces sp. Ac-502]|uniref:hypothetical protein n=1 Tax=Streptomyces sp. Ac-502 TaxID=3342801 RepID=UPI0038629B85
MNTDFHVRAAAVLGASGGRIHWPYGMALPQRTKKYREDPQAYEEATEEARKRQERLVRWAEQHELKLSDAGCCPHWLQRKISRRCPNVAYPSPCTRYGSQNGAPDYHWLDHVTSWLRNGRPAVLAAAPYGVNSEDEQRLAFWAKQDSRLRMTRGDGWYGFSTTHLIMWRSDHIGTVSPA